MILATVTESDAPPGLRYAALTLVAEALGARTVLFDPRRQAEDDVHALQHVTLDGRLGPNGLLWIDRSALDAQETEQGSAALVEDGMPREFHAVWRTPEHGVVQDVRGGRFADLVRDRFGRPRLHDAGDTADDLVADRSRNGPRLVVVGETDRLRDVYPAVLAAIGDSADALGLDPDICIVSPRAVRDWADLLDGADGLLLPGGAEMGQVEGQVSAAERALAMEVPTLGLCLGMQTMTVALARTLCGVPDATLEELAPFAPDPVFVRLLDISGSPYHRLGPRPIDLEANPEFPRRFALPTRWTERMNHRYGIGASWRERISAVPGLRLAISREEKVMDLVAFDDHPFFIGSQGHPELSSTGRNPAPLVMAWLKTCALTRSFP